jgi:hypothetical protein
MRSIAVLVSFLGFVLVSCSAPSPEETVAIANQALTYSESVLGFETIADNAWTLTPTDGVLAIDDRHSEGEHSAKVTVGASQRFTLTSALVSGVSSATDKLWFDVWIPSGNYTWRGSMNLFIESKSCNAYNIGLGGYSFTAVGAQYGYDKFVRYSASLTGYPQWVISCAKNDLKVTLTGDAPAGSYFLFDRIYFGQGTEPTTLPTTATVEIDLPSGLAMTDGLFARICGLEIACLRVT